MLPLLGILGLKSKDLIGYTSMQFIFHFPIVMVVVAAVMFHEAMLHCSGNGLLTGIVMNLRDNMRLYGIESSEGLERQRASVAEHYELVRLVHAGDRAAAVPLMRHHIRVWEPVFTAALRLG